MRCKATLPRDHKSTGFTIKTRHPSLVFRQINFYQLMCMSRRSDQNNRALLFFQKPDIQFRGLGFQPGDLLCDASAKLTDHRNNGILFLTSMHIHISLLVTTRP